MMGAAYISGDGREAVATSAWWGFDVIVMAKRRIFHG